MADAAAGGEPHSETAPQDASNYFACARAHALDLASTLILFFCASISAGRVWRFPFDDEIYTLTRTQMRSVFKVFPKNSEMLFYGLHHLGLSDPQMRLCSLAMTGLALVLFQLLALTWIAQHSETVRPACCRSG
jgi:hypothetical protein